MNHDETLMVAKSKKSDGIVLYIKLKVLIWQVRNVKRPQVICDSSPLNLPAFLGTTGYTRHRP